MSQYRCNRQSGFTLVEALIVMALLGIFLTILTSLLTSVIGIQNQTTSYSAVMSDGRFIMSRLDYDIARASAVTTPAALGASASSLDITISGTPYTYTLSGGNLQLSDGLGTDNLNGNQSTISGVSFLRLGNSDGIESIRYSFTVTSTATHNGQTDTQTFTSTVERRS